MEMCDVSAPYAYAPIAAPQGPNTFELIPHRVFVGGFPSNTTEGELRMFFERFGTVREVKLIKSNEGHPKGYGFITFNSELEAAQIRGQPPETLEFKNRRLNIGPAMRRLNITTRQSDLSLATPQIVPPSTGYATAMPHIGMDNNTHIPQQTMGIPQQNGGYILMGPGGPPLIQSMTPISGPAYSPQQHHQHQHQHHQHQQVSPNSGRRITPRKEMTAAAPGLAHHPHHHAHPLTPITPTNAHHNYWQPAMQQIPVTPVGPNMYQLMDMSHLVQPAGDHQQSTIAYQPYMLTPSANSMLAAPSPNNPMNDNRENGSIYLTESGDFEQQMASGVADGKRSMNSAESSSLK